MIRTYLQCDFCGDKWDISDTKYYKSGSSPGYSYVKDCISRGKRKYIIQKGTFTTDERLEKDDMDICDRCYNKLNTLIMSIEMEIKEN